MEDKPFRVLLDFSEVNARISGLKYVWMHVSPRELNTINDFKQAIVNKFPFFTQESFKLLVRDGLLLETEKVAVLREDDTVKIQLENPCETLMEECSPIDKNINVSMAQASSHSVSSSAVSLNKSRKRKSETFIASSKEKDNNSSASISKKKRKQDKTICLEEESNNSLQDLSGLDKSSKSDASQKDKSNKQSIGKKRKSYPKTPTSDFITFAVKLSEAERMNQNAIQSDVNDRRVEYNITDTNLYKTAESVSKTNLSPIPEMSTYVLSSSQTPNLTESLNYSESQVNAQNSSKSGCKKRRRKRKRKMVPSTEGLSFSTNASTEMEESFLADVKSNETYDTSSDTRKHIIFHSPTPPEASPSKALDIDLNCSSDGPKVLPIGNNKLKNKSLREDTQLNAKFEKDCKSGINEIVDYTKESTPFSKTKLKQKSWGVTPLPKITTSSNTFAIEKVHFSKTGVKPVYQNYTPLNSLPPVGTHLAYKTLELNQDYCPEVTEYKEGILRKVDPNTDELEIELIQEEFKPGKSGKFENLWKDEPLPEDQVIKTVSLNWTALIEPRLIPS